MPVSLLREVHLLYAYLVRPEHSRSHRSVGRERLVYRGVAKKRRTTADRQGPGRPTSTNTHFLLNRHRQTSGRGDVIKRTVDMSINRLSLTITKRRRPMRGNTSDRRWCFEEIHERSIMRQRGQCLLDLVRQPVDESREQCGLNDQAEVEDISGVPGDVPLLDHRQVRSSPEQVPQGQRLGSHSQNIN
ncbi:hypothetical protein L917_16201 [Phytophthora nicotianae]|uniref:Uncharacterized protein n=1 Tax=Phytophthora nicotianae TaxID=4792 RepID=W2KH07_PHYNI|nr:hypothetical protein L917_16201 [Phytophthora nicotianae]